MAGRVAGKVALVSGAGTGIGRAVAVRLAEEGADVVVTSRTLAHVHATCREVERATGRLPHGEALDVSDRETVDRVVAEVVERHGRVDILVANAGIDLVEGPAVWETSDEDWERVFDVNVTGVFRLCRACLPHMPAGGAIVAMASINSLVAWPRNAAYTATKGALLQFTRACALDALERGVRVNCVCPGVIDTPLTDLFLDASDDPEALRAEYDAVAPMGRMGTAREVANCALFLASDEASFVTGTSLVVDGGTIATV
jgi:NAD(P)-dependent dehydrogenase (short-subunit alcohol dehydrogenase family)